MPHKHLQKNDKQKNDKLNQKHTKKNDKKDDTDNIEQTDISDESNISSDLNISEQYENFAELEENSKKKEKTIRKDRIPKGKDNNESDTSDNIINKDAEIDEGECLYHLQEPVEESNIETFNGENNTDKLISNEKRITTQKLTKYEMVNIIGTRARQLSLGAVSLIKNAQKLPPKKVAKLELYNKVCPIILKRRLPSGEYELIDVNILNIL